MASSASTQGSSSSTRMEVDGVEKACVMASPAITGSVSVALHPLVIMNISEHWTRAKAQHGQPERVLGALIGKQNGRNIEVMNSFELVYYVEGGLLDREYYNTKEQQFKMVFSDLDFLGWYTTGDEPTEQDVKVHTQVCEINESPIFLQMSPNVRTSTDLPIKIYESVVDLLDGKTTILFVELPYTLATEEAERIGVDHVARVSNQETSESSLVAEHLTAQHSAIAMLHNRVKLILEYIKAVNEGKLPKNHEILREAYSLCHRLPVLSTAKFSEEFYNQCNDVSLMTYLGTMTKSCNTVNLFINKFNLLYDRQGGRRVRGLFF